LASDEESDAQDYSSRESGQEEAVQPEGQLATRKLADQLDMLATFLQDRAVATDNCCGSILPLP
jgi:hypothetical protein